MAINVKGSIPTPPTTTTTAPMATQTVKAAQSIAQPKTGELFAAMSVIKKQLGDKSIVYGNQIPNPERLPTGVFEFDLACVVGSSVIQDAVTGVPHTIYDLVSKKVPLPVASLNEKNHKFDCGQITNWVSKGLRECYTITTEGGDQTTVAAEHAFLTEAGWVKANQLTCGDSLIRPLRFNWRFGDNLMDDQMLRFLAYWLADGNGTGDGSPKISDVDPDTVADFYGIAESKGYTLTHDGLSYSFVGGPEVRNWKGQKVQTNIFRGMLLDLGVWGATAQHKQIPAHIFSLRKHQIAQFLSSMWMCDGTVHKYKKSASYSTVSPVLANQVQFILQRLGIPAYTRSQPAEDRVMPGGKTSQCLECFTVYVTGDYSIKKLADTLTLMGDKHLRLQTHANAPYSNREARLLRNRSGHSTYYSKVVTIEPAGLQEVYDVTVSPHHNLIIDGVIGHNTGGGFPKNRYSIVYGPESSGKTNLVYKAIASAQRLPPPCNKAVFVDLEGTFDPAWAAQFGIDVDALIVAKPSYGEQAVDMIDALVRASDVAFLAVDSIAVLVAARELEGSTEKADVGTAALLTKRPSHTLAAALSADQKRDHNVCVVLLNQTRFKIGVMFGDPETTPGGQTVKFNASLIVRLFGKNKLVKEISSQVPAFKETHAVIKKAKIGILQAAFDYDMVMYEHDGLCPGDTASFNAVKGYLQSAGHLKKSEKGGGWELLGKTYPTLAPIQDTYYAEPSFAQTLNQLVVKSQSMTTALALVVAEPEAPVDFNAPTVP